MTGAQRGDYDAAGRSPVELLDALDALRAEATPGPWEVHPEHPEIYDPARGARERLTADCLAAVDNMADAACIVAEHNAVPALVAALRAVLAKCDAMEREAPKPQVGGFIADEFRATVAAALAPEGGQAG